jgi:uncharacterized protein (DUF58 family)
MGYRGKQKLSKFAFAQRVAASLAYLLLGQLDAVGLLTHDTKPRQFIPPKATSKHLLTLLQHLEATTVGGETSLGRVWDRIAGQHLKRRGLVVLLSDCYSEMPGITRALRHLRYGRHEVILFQIVAPEELDFPFSNPTKFRSLEAKGYELTVDARRLREEYRKNFDDHRRELRRVAEELGIDYQLLRTDQPVERALGAYLARR